MQVYKTNACRTNRKWWTQAVAKRFRVIMADCNFIAEAMTIWGCNDTNSRNKRPKMTRRI
ncbi:hypothetical protein X777_04974 [Ooceraea biroi]|uniref:Uncharacterized protein n=1 Tax=Ooceraea biroi TaxID=2015173 RepID=A0A026WHX2_OOCBI|nr:hypothetical protein X777_04974 [Ooceraea biroi]